MCKGTTKPDVIASLLTQSDPEQKILNFEYFCKSFCIFEIQYSNYRYMRAAAFFILILFSCNLLQAQDTLYKSNGTISPVKILEIKQAQVRYRYTSTPDGPVFVIPKEYISKIVYSTGETVSFSVLTTSPAASNDMSYNKEPKWKNGRNFISLNMADLIIGMVTFNYEYTLNSGYLSFKFPINTGFRSFIQDYDTYYSEGYLPKMTIIGSGINLNFYPGGQGQVAYFVGPSLELRAYRDYRSFYYPNTSTYVTEREIGILYGLLIQNGVLFQAGPHLNLSLNLGLGYGNRSSFGNTFGYFMTRAGANIGYKF